MYTTTTRRIDDDFSNGDGTEQCFSALDDDIYQCQLEIEEMG